MPLIEIINNQLKSISGYFLTNEKSKKAKVLKLDKYSTNLEIYTIIATTKREMKTGTKQE
jgi:hypothetical protein